MPTLTPIDNNPQGLSLAQLRAMAEAEAEAKARAEAEAAQRAANDPNNPANVLRKPWEDYQQQQRSPFGDLPDAQQPRLPWQDYQQQPQSWSIEKQRAMAAADQARVQSYISQAKARVAAGPYAAAFGIPQMPAADPNTGQPVGVPAFSPNDYGRMGSATMGAADTMTFGFGDELASYPTSLLTGIPRDQILQEIRHNQSAAQSQNPGSYLAGQIGGGVAQAALGAPSLGVNAGRAGVGLGRVALNSAIDGGLYGGAYGAGSANGDLADRLKGGAIGAGTGAVAGGVAPFLSTAITKGISKLISPFASSPEREAAVNLLAQEGVPVTAGQRTGNDGLRYAESELGGSKASRLMKQQNAAFTDAAMQKAGGSGLATADNLASLQGTLGQAFQDMSSRNTLVADNQLVQDIGTTVNRYGRLLEPQQKPIVENLATDLVQRIRANGGTLPGPEYQTIRSDLSSAANSTTNQTIADAFRGLRNALDDAMGRSIPADEQQAWQTLRSQYGNMKVLQKASLGGGEDAGLGVISPARLRMAASSGNAGRFATGASDYTDLAKAGQAVMTPLPNSGTAARIAAHTVGLLGPSLVGGAYGYREGGDWESALAGAAAGMALKKGAGAALMSRLGQGYLGNQLAAGMSNPSTNALLAAIMRQGGTPAIVNSLAH
ncbi:MULTISPECIES: hypothetical protein [unclassified Mesorhizobium]|uniref:hypothetical protein n=1 Tax=unclassified Mesorhizobium TaxID=325217 RepID=UPI000FCB5699|nr:MULTISPECIES: hypothetical protein [unclassified Mesorhizobium]TGU07851.1 hypothetical protein EN806_31395 [bacterium M00.F.Ca.ET.163.01.1.1]TGU47057.1 hypothetical protein EN789_13570 [bacterium M00.F.Ca.ET.146.01.1.1]TGW12715.1 hypothetical protein EN788_08135 [Mesorhizobium sp. M2D.F.Ca.ET.145.01.1.1]TGP33333.1 hypothetical protein EN875_015435 [Mesorhizobium sp. M2D.F.Ca.ET.232.01.1.1]TGP59369.1 hypothetical protein EN869_013905 [Mesorhizobium sp. M2D.F.Ca.ET.226.01.1.1]